MAQVNTSGASVCWFGISICPLFFVPDEEQKAWNAEKKVGGSNLYLGVRCLSVAYSNMKNLLLGVLEAVRPHTPNTQMEAKCFIWWPLTNHTEPPLAANTAAAYWRQALIWVFLIAFKVFTLIKRNSCNIFISGPFKVGWSKCPQQRLFRTPQKRLHVTLRSINLYPTWSLFTALECMFKKWYE